MKPIDNEFKYDGYVSRLMQRRGRVAMFERTKPGVAPHWEVIILRIEPARTFPSGKSYPEREVMPPTESWGVEGWSYSRREDAEARFRQTPIPQDASEASGRDKVPAAAEDRLRSDTSMRETANQENQP